MSNFYNIKCNIYNTNIFPETSLAINTEHFLPESEPVMTIFEVNVESGNPNLLEETGSFDLKGFYNENWNNYYNIMNNNNNNDNNNNNNNNNNKNNNNSNNVFNKVNNSSTDTIKIIKPKLNSNLQFDIDRPIPEPFFEKDIIQIVRKKFNNYSGIITILSSNTNKQNNFVKKVKKEISEKIIKRNKRYNLEVKDTKQFGRKRKNDESIRSHNKYTADNIINKIKNILKKYLITFVNNIIFCLYTQEKINKILTTLKLPKHVSLSLIKDIDYKSIANIKNKKENLALLNLSVRKFLSFNVSDKYKRIKYKENENLTKYNKLIIDHLFKDEKNKAIFNFIFNELNLENWLDIFIHQKELDDFPQFKLLNKNEAVIIEESLVRLENFLEELNKEGEVYFLCFILLIFNYRRYYSIKQERKRNKNNSNNSNSDGIDKKSNI